MNVSLIGEQIAKFRRERALTQEELGRAVGVSTQAVSRWECGGAPDIALLSAIADKLGVDIDALFGREGGVKEDMAGEVRRWLLSVPEGKRMDALGRLMWDAVKAISCRWLEQFDMRYMERCTLIPDGMEEEVLLRTVLELEGEGLIFGVGAEDMSFMSVWPRPEAGWAAYFSEMEDYRRLFRVLAEPNCLELLQYLHDEPKPRHYAARALAARLDMPVEEVGRLLEELKEVHLVRTQEVELEGGPAAVYTVHQNWAFVPFLYFTRCFMEEHDAFYLVWDDYDISRAPGSRRGRLGPARRDKKSEDIH